MKGTGRIRLVPCSGFLGGILAVMIVVLCGAIGATWLAGGCERGAQSPWRGEGPVVAVYTGDGAAEACSAAAIRMFAWMGYEVATIGANDVNYSDIARFDLLYFPGGSSGPYERDISVGGKARVRAFVAAGGRYIGTCAGAHFAATTSEWRGEAYTGNGLSLFPGEVRGPIPELIIDSAYDMTRLTLHPHAITAGRPDSAWVMYYNGPYFSFDSCQEIEVVASYDVTGSPAMVAFEYGGGRVFLTGPHPEWEEDSDRDGVDYFDGFDDRGSDWDLMLRATRWCFGKIDEHRESRR